MKYEDLLNFDYSSNKSRVYDLIVSKIESAIESDKLRITIKQLLIIDEKIDVVIERSEWPMCIERAREHYLSIEDFESCAKCKSISDKLSIKKNQK